MKAVMTTTLEKEKVLMLQFGLYSNEALEVLDFMCKEYIIAIYNLLPGKFVYRTADGELFIFIEHDYIRWPCGINAKICKCKFKRHISPNGQGPNCKYYLDCIIKLYKNMFTNMANVLLKELHLKYMHHDVKVLQASLKAMKQFLKKDKASEEFIGQPLDPFRLEGIKFIENELFNMSMNDDRWSNLIEEYDKLIGRKVS